MSENQRIENEAINYDQNNFLLQVFMNNTDRSVILSDPSLNIILFNKLADKWATHYAGKSLYNGMPLIELASEDRKEQQLQLMNHVLEGNQCEVEYRIELEGGDYVCFSNIYIPARNDNKEIVGLLINSKDITEQKKREDQLKKSDERFQLIVKATTDAIWDYDILQSKVFYNESFTRYFGHQPADWEDGYELWERHIHPEDRKRVIAGINSVIAGTDTHWQDEYRFLTHEGKIAFVYDRGIIVRNDVGEPVRMMGSMQDITRQKQSEIAIALSEHRFRSLVQSGTDLIGILDQAGNYMYVSPTARQLGYDADFIIGKNAFDFIHPDDQEKMSEFVAAVLADPNQQVSSIPFRFQDAFGEWRWVETVATNLIGDPAINGIVVNSRDITEKKRREGTLQKALNDLNKIMDSSVDVIVVTDAENKFVAVSAASETMWGYKPKELIGKPCFDLVHPDDRENTVSITNQVMQGKKITNFQNRYVRKDGTTVPLIWSAKWDPQEKVMYAIARNATEKLEAEVALRKSEAMFRAISESFPNGVVAILDKELRFLYMAGQEMETLGLSRNYFLGTTYDKHFPDDDLMIRHGAEEVFAGKTEVTELRFMNRNYLVSSVPLYEEDGSVQRILVVAQNITPQKNAQREKELLINELTSNIHDLRQFSYITSHNLRSPISNLIGIMSLINLDAITDRDTRFLVEKFKESTYILNETVNDLLNILLIKNNVNVSTETFRLSEVWKDVRTSVSSQLKKANAVIETSLFDDEVSFNKSYAESILLNLLTNSLKYRHPQRQLQITLRSHAENNFLVVQFSDNGIGINLEHHREKIFGLYQRFHNYPDSKGLGLYIVHSQITALGGKIEVESEPDIGTTFTLYFKR